MHTKSKPRESSIQFARAAPLLEVACASELDTCDLAPRHEVLLKLKILGHPQDDLCQENLRQPVTALAPRSTRACLPIQSIIHDDAHSTNLRLLSISRRCTGGY